ncbi:MAG: hypothetical protein WCO29_13575, partial [Nostocales cyanobacterium ELA583]
IVLVKSGQSDKTTRFSTHKRRIRYIISPKSDSTYVQVGRYDLPEPTAIVFNNQTLANNSRFAHLKSSYKKAEQFNQGFRL